MKHISYWVVLLATFFVASDTFAQEVQSRAPNGLAGVWQICLSQPAPDGSTPLRTGPFLKIIAKNGDLTNLVIYSGGHTSILTATGICEQTSDSTYTETMSYATFAPLIGKPNPLKYKLVDDKYLYLEFRVAGEPNVLKETWVKVTPAAVREKGQAAPMEKQREDGAYYVPEVLPLFPGGQEKMMQYLSTNIKYPKEALEQRIGGRVIIQFVIDAEGDLTAPKVVRGIHPLLDAEALRVVSEMPRWTPGTVDGKAVPVIYNVPINFSLPAVPKTVPLIAVR